MHHRVTSPVTSEYDMTPGYFRQELARLHAEGYYPVRTIDLARGDLGHVPAGKTPVVLSFDDSSPGQFGYTPDGRIAADSGVGILLDFARAHPGFPAVASFYINHHPFRLPDTAQALRDLHRLGMEIGNHTFHHRNLGQLTPAEVQAELAELASLVSHAVPGLTPATMALPLGVDPHPTMLAASGSAEGTRYRNEAVLLAGANPTRSPFHAGFDPLAVPRIRSSSYQGGRGRFLAGFWLDYLKAHPEQRYVAAGNPGTVTFPRRLAAGLAGGFRDRGRPY
jgi:hypothetical protein